MEKVTVKRDTREKINNGYYWEENEWCDGYVQETIKIGDYTLVGYEDILAVERKASTGEIARNVYEARFERELEKLSKIKYSFLLYEFSLDDVINFPVNSGIPVKKWDELKVTSKFLLKKIAEYQVKYDVKILFCGNKLNAWNMLNSIFKRVIENERHGC